MSYSFIQFHGNDVIVAGSSTGGVTVYRHNYNDQVCATFILVNVYKILTYVFYGVKI